MTQKVFEASSMDAPWMRRQDWACGRIRCVGLAKIVVFWVMAVLWNGFTWTWMILIWGDPEEEAVVKVLWFFCLIGLGLFAWAVRRTWAWLRFGESVLELASVPGVIGGTLEGQIQTGIQTSPTKPIQLALICIRKHSVKRFKRESEITQDIIWQTDRSVAVGRFNRGPRGLAIPLHILIPYGLPNSDNSNVDEQILWQLVVSGDLPGIDFRAEFLVPVFVTANSKSEWTEEKVDEMVFQERKAYFSSALPRAESWVSPVTTRPTQSGGMEYVFHLDVPLKMAMGLTLLTVLFCVGSVGLYLWLGEMGPFAVLPGVFGLLLLLATVMIWTFKTRVLIEGGLVTVRKSIFGIPRIWRVPFSQISRVRVRHEKIEGVKENDRDWEILIDRKEGSSVNLGASIRDRSEAERLAETIRQLTR